MPRFPSCIVLTLAFVSILAATAWAQVPRARFTYQGRLTNEMGQPLTGNHVFQFELHGNSGRLDAPEEMQDMNVPVNNGLFEVTLDFQARYFDGRDLWLKIAVKNDAGTYEEITPVQGLTGSPYALGLKYPFRGEDRIDSPLADQMVYLSNSGNVPVLRIEGHQSDQAVRITNAGRGRALGLEVIAPDSASLPVVGFSTRVRVGDADQAPSVSPEEAAAVGGDSYAAQGPGGYANRRRGPQGEALPVVGFISQGDDIGVWTTAPNAGGRGVQAHVVGPGGIGLLGTTDLPNGTLNPDATAVGVKGYSYQGAAVLGESPQGLAGRFVGSVDVSGSLTVGGSKQFLIDHPLDPQHKLLAHACVESDAMVNLYRGNVTLDARGAADIRLPDWFDALNTNLNYQLTPIGGPAPDLHVAEEVRDGRFRISGGTPGLKVSWMVSGERNDRFARENPLQVVQDKSDLAGGGR